MRRLPAAGLIAALVVGAGREASAGGAPTHSLRSSVGSTPAAPALVPTLRSFFLRLDPLRLSLPGPLTRLQAVNLDGPGGQRLLRALALRLQSQGLNEGSFGSLGSANQEALVAQALMFELGAGPLGPADPGPPAVDAKVRRAVERLAREWGLGGAPFTNDNPAAGIAWLLRQGPIDGGGYASEGRFLRLLKDSAAVGPEEGIRRAVGPRTRLLEDVASRGGEAGGGLLALNLSILADDLYLGAEANRAAPADRLRLAELRERFGASSVKTYAQLGIKAPGDRRPARAESPILRGFLSLADRLPFAGPILRETFAYVRPSELGETGFPAVVERWARSDRHRKRLSLFFQQMARLNTELDSLPRPPSVWELALKVNGGDAREAAEMLGAIVGQKKQPLRHVERHVLPLHPDAQGADEAFADAARTYYLLGVAHERSLRKFGASALYPQGSGLRSPKFWHFYAAAMTADHVLRQGHTPLAARIAGVLLAAAYEAYSLPFNLRLGTASGLDALLDCLLDAIKDVRTQAAGNKWVLGRDPGAAGRRPNPFWKLFDWAEHALLRRVLGDARWRKLLLQILPARSSVLYRGAGPQEVAELEKNGWLYPPQDPRNLFKFATPSLEVARGFARKHGGSVLAIEADQALPYHKLFWPFGWTSYIRTVREHLILPTGGERIRRIEILAGSETPNGG